ncbi:hypothetical protein IWW38_000196 [Coemansia aciculifera]|uniref:Uncharacterized protein n=1 Tax=Coemansia aciculifera TaxID=417176 RepID=A0ACC1M9U4_9FUNG|nr:hypothetical protein IWW38_000196 [Coemansia aciculifera]
MEYETYYLSLWDQVKRPSEAAQNYDDVRIKLTKFATAIGDSDNGKRISRDQWIDSLAVAASFAAPGFEWADFETRALADKWIKEILSHLDIGESDAKLPVDIFQTMCAKRVKPYFGSRSGGGRTSQQLYVLMNSDNIGSKSSFSDSDRWRKHPQCVATFTWALRRLRTEDIVESISSILPVVLALVEDYDCQAKLWGLRAAKLLLDNSDDQFLRKSGIAGVMEKSTRECLTFRSEPGLGAELLQLGFETAIRLAQIMYVQRDDAKYTAHWWALTERVIANNMYISDNIAANSVLCAQIAPLCAALGPTIARYLRPLVGILTRSLHSPIYLSPLICQLHMAAMEQLLALIAACPQRASKYCLEIVGALAYSWSGTRHEKSSELKDVDNARELAQSVLKQLVKISPKDVIDTAVARLYEARPETFSAWKEILQHSE